MVILIETDHDVNFLKMHQLIFKPQVEIDKILQMSLTNLFYDENVWL